MCSSENSGERLGWTYIIDSDWHRGGTRVLGMDESHQEGYGEQRERNVKGQHFCGSIKMSQEETERRVRELEKSRRGQYPES